jgi:hypothetical protein
MVLTALFVNPRQVVTGRKIAARTKIGTVVSLGGTAMAAPECIAASE